VPTSDVGRSEEIQATVYQKHRSPQSHKDAVWGLTPAQCRKVKEVGQGATLKLATEAPVNGGRNYNGPKVAKFLVG
jgi:hypothetical protein